jgi:hypothetical protein
MGDPDVIAGVDRHADDGAHQPVIGQRLGPRRIDFEAGHQGRCLQERHAGFSQNSEREDHRQRKKVSARHAVPPQYGRTG